MEYAHYPAFKEYLACCRTAFATTAAGGMVRIYWNTPILNAEGWREEFRAALDKRINVKAGLRSDGAPKRSKCRCMHCTAKCDCACRKFVGTPAPIVGDCGYGCRFPWGGRKWDSDYEGNLIRDRRAIEDRVTRRISLYQINTPELRQRFAHLLSERYRDQ
jgi:hypothetical protein